MKFNLENGLNFSPYPYPKDLDLGPALYLGFFNILHIKQPSAPVNPVINQGSTCVKRSSILFFNVE